MHRSRELVFAETVHMWLWWTTFTVCRETGSGVTAAFKAAQQAVKKLYP